LAQFENALREARARARQQLLDALSGPRYKLLLHALKDALSSASPEAGKADLRGFAEAAITASYRRYSRKAQHVSASSTDEELHDLRKRARRLRYTIEFARGLYGSPAKRLLRALEAEQDILGEYQDCTEWLRQLRELGLNDAVYADGAGSLSALSYTRMSELRTGLPGALARVEERWLLLQPQL
jgi:CHAD domain-containing protein